MKKFGSDSNAVRVLYTIVTHYTSLPPSFQNKSFSAEAGKPINNADQPDSPAETGPDLATQISQAKQENVSQVTEEVDDESKAAMASSIIYFIVIRVLMVKVGQTRREGGSGRGFSLTVLSQTRCFLSL